MFYFYGSIVASIILYVSSVMVVKRIINDRDEGWPVIIGSISLAFIVASIIILCGK